MDKKKCFVVHKHQGTKSGRAAQSYKILFQMILSFRRNSADPDQTAPRGAVWSGSTLFAISAASFGYVTLW